MGLSPDQIQAATKALQAISEGVKHLPGQHNQQDHGRRGRKAKLSLAKMRETVSEIDGYVPLSRLHDPEVLGFARELGNLTYGDYTTKIDLKASDASPNSVHVSSDIFYKRKRIGYFSRVIQYDDNSLYNNSLTIKPEYQGQGVAEAIYRHVEEVAANEGVTEVRLTANDDIGGYAWARRGFQWATPKEARIPMTWVKEIARGKPGKGVYIGENGDWFTLTPELIADAKKLISGGRIPTPAEIASLGEKRRGTHVTVTTKAGKPIPLWIGKSIMLGSSWNGVKPIGVGLWKKDTLADWMVAVEDALPYAVDQFVPGDVFRPHDGATSDYNIFGADLFAQPVIEEKSWIDSYTALVAMLEEKQRHVRDAAFWGAPVGTPLPLPDKPDVTALPEPKRRVRIESVGDMNVMWRDEARKMGLDPDNQHYERAIKMDVARRIELRLSDIPTDELIAALYFDAEDPDTNDDIKQLQDAMMATTPVSHIILGSRGQIMIDDPSYFEGLPDYLGRDSVPTGTAEAESIVRQYLVSRLISTWAASSNDSNPLALALQEGAAAEFGMTSYADWDIQDGRTASVLADIWDLHGSTYQKFLRAQYDETQAMFDRQNISEIVLYRGYVINNRETLAEDVAGDEIVDANVRLRPMSSWTTDRQVAARFASYADSEPAETAVVMKTTIPTEEIIGTALTGFGCWNEREVVSLRGDIDAAVTTGQGSVVWQEYKSGKKHSITADDSDRNADWIKAVGTDVVLTIEDYFSIHRSVKSDPAVWDRLATTLEELKSAMQKGSPS